MFQQRKPFSGGRREKTLDGKMAGKALGILLVIIAIILALVQHFGGYNLYGDISNKWYFYGLLMVIGIIGIILAAWGYMKPSPKATEAPKEAMAPAA